MLSKHFVSFLTLTRLSPGKDIRLLFLNPVFLKMSKTLLAMCAFLMQQKDLDLMKLSGQSSLVKQYALSSSWVKIELDKDLKC